MPPSCARQRRKIRTSTRFCRERAETTDMPRTRSLAWSELKIGIVAVVAMALAIMLIVAVGGQGGFSWQRYELKTKFANVQGLKSGRHRAGCRRRGRQSHRRRLRRRRRRRSSSKSTRSSGARITDQSRASIGSLSLLGEPTIEISPSSPGHAAEGRRLHPERADARPDQRRRGECDADARADHRADQGDSMRAREPSASYLPTTASTAK